MNGAAPLFAEKRHVGRPNLGSRERLLARFGEIIDRRWLSNHGPVVQEFEAKLCELLGVRHCIPMCNATVGLEIAIRALDLTGEVIVPAFTFVATAHALRWQGLTPVFCDIDPRTHNLDPARVEALIGPRTSGIIGVHVWGRPCAVEALAEIAKRRKLRLLYDAAHALGCAHGGRMIGGFGDAEVFSFHATKFVNSAEGGAIATNDDALAARIRLMKNFGFAGLDRVIHLGTNGKMSEFSAALGLTNLEEIDDFVAVNRRNYEAYQEGLRGLAGVALIEYPKAERQNFQYIVIEIDAAAAGRSRDELLTMLQGENVLARRYFYPGCHRMEPYLVEQPGAEAGLPETERLCGRVLVLPTGTAVSLEDVGAICGLLRDALSTSRR